MNTLMNKRLDPFFIGFDRLLETHNEMKTNNYPPYNLTRKNENDYTIELAVAGFTKDSIKIKLNRNNKTLRISGELEEEKNCNFIHKGIACRKFTKTFTITDNVEVRDVFLENGILTLELTTVYSEEKEQEIQIS